MRPPRRPLARSTAASGTVTHLFNAMRPFRHRDPGIAGAALARDDVIVQVILDGVHLADETARVVWRRRAGRIALVTDAIAAAGVGDGAVRLGAIEVEVRDGVARRDGRRPRRERRRRCRRRSANLHALGASLVEAVAAATSVPARVLGRDDVGDAAGRRPRGRRRARRPARGSRGATSAGAIGWRRDGRDRPRPRDQGVRRRRASRSTTSRCTIARRRVHGARRPVGLRQVDAAAD